MTDVRWAIGILVATAILGGLAWATYAFAPAIGPVDRRDLAYSVTDEVGGAVPFTGIDRCRRRAGELRCYVEDSSHSGAGATYAVRRRGRRCWSARKRRRETEGRSLPERARGCVSLRQQLR